MPAPLLAAPLVIPFAEAIGLSVATLGIAKASDMVKEFIQENPEESMKIFQMIMPSQGIANILKNKSDDGEEISEEELGEIETPKLTGKEKSERIKAAIRRARGEKGLPARGNYSSPDAEGSAVDIGGSVIREVEDMGIADKDLKDNYDPNKKKFNYKRFYKKKYADGGAIGIEVLFEEKNPRQGLFMGGLPLTGQALNIYNSMNSYGFDDQAIADALLAQGLYTASGSTPDTPGTTIQPIDFQGGNEDGGGITQLDPLNTRTNIASGINRNDRSFIDPLNEKIANQMKSKNRNLESRTNAEIISSNPDMFDIKTDKGFMGNTIDNFKTMGGNLIDKFSGSKVGQGATKFKNMAFTPMMALAQKRNPLNPGASNYNPNLQKQMDFLGAKTGTRITGTSDNLNFTDGLAMIGINPNTGQAQYGPGSVLSGQNVVSGFGTNDYEKQLGKYITKMRNYTTLTNFQKAKLEQAKAEVAKEIARREKETADRARAANPAVYARADELGFTDGKGGGFGSKSTGTNENFSNESGRGRTGYGDGGLATMFKEKR